MTRVPCLPRPPVDARPLYGRYVDLELVDLDRHEADLWQAIGSDPTRWGGVPSGPFETRAAFRAWLIERSDRADYKLYAIIDKTGEQRRAVGIYCLLHIDPEMGTIEMGLFFGQTLTRRTGGTEGFFLLARYVFETLEYRRMEWRCNTTNTASGAAAERFGFTLEGIMRQYQWVKGANYDSALYSILDGEWPAISRRLTAWLAPENFSDEGRQIRALSAFE